MPTKPERILNYMHLKSKCIAHISARLKAQIVDMQALIAAAENDRNAEQKSSAGDKYETGREMIQQEVDKYRSLLSRYQKELHLVESLGEATYDTVKLGSLVRCDQTLYLLLIPFGKLQVDDYEVFVVSPASPVGNLLLHKKAGDSFQLNGKTNHILQIL